MADLEELGYLSQPHTSAGQMPSIKAIDFMLLLIQLKDLMNATHYPPYSIDV